MYFQKVGGGKAIFHPYFVTLQGCKNFPPSHGCCKAPAARTVVSGCQALRKVGNSEDWGVLRSWSRSLEGILSKMGLYR